MKEKDCINTKNENYDYQFVFTQLLLDFICVLFITSGDDDDDDDNDDGGNDDNDDGGNDDNAIDNYDDDDDDDKARVNGKLLVDACLQLESSWLTFVQSARPQTMMMMMMMMIMRMRGLMMLRMIRGYQGIDQNRGEISYDEADRGNCG